MLNNMTTTYHNDSDDNGVNNGRGGLIINWDDNDGGMELDFDDEFNEDNGRTQRAIWYSMVGTYELFPSLYSQ